MRPVVQSLILAIAAIAALYVTVVVPNQPYDDVALENLELLDAELVDRPAPDFVLGTVDEEELRLSDLRGQAVFLNFWASWCEPCREEMPSMVALANEMRGERFRMVAVSLDEDEEALIDFLLEHDVDPNVITVAQDSDGEIARRYGTELIPETYLIDPDGQIVARFRSAYDWQRPQVRGLIRRVVMGLWSGRSSALGQ